MNAIPGCPSLSFKQSPNNKEAIELIKSASYEMQKPNVGFIALVMVSISKMDHGFYFRWLLISLCAHMW